MIKFSKFNVYGLEEAIRGMRNPLNSWHKSDSAWVDEEYVVGVADRGLMEGLAKAGRDHRKYLRQVFVSVDITAPLYWWKQFDQYKVGVTTNSQSTMHCIHKNSFKTTLEDFSFDFHNERSGTREVVNVIVGHLNFLREQYLKTGDKGYWQEMIQLLPSSYNQTRTVSLSYEVLINIYFSRCNHKLYEWQEFCSEIESLPNMAGIIASIKNK